MKRYIFICILTMVSALSATAQVDKRDVRRGNRDYKKENYREAEIEYRKGIVKDSMSVAANYNLAADLYRQNNAQEAQKVLDRIKDVAPQSENAADYYYNLGDVAIANQDWQGAVNAFQIRLIPQKTGSLFTNGAKRFNDSFTNTGLKDAVALTVKLSFNLYIAQAGNRRVNGHQVGNAGLVGRIIADTELGVGVGNSPLELTLNILRPLHQEHTTFRHGLAHLAVRSIQAHNTGTGLGNKGLGNFKNIAINAIEPLGNITSQLTVLLLVMSHRNKIRLIKQNVRSHQGRIGKQTTIDIFCISGRLILELCHAAQLTKHGITVENPTKLGVLMYMTLDKKGILFWI